MTGVAKPLSSKRDNGFRGERAGESNNSKKSQRSERTGLKEVRGRSMIREICGVY